MHYLSWLECSIQESRGWKSEGGSGLEVRLKVSEDLLVTGFNCYAKESGLYFINRGVHGGFLSWEMIPSEFYFRKRILVVGWIVHRSR